MIKESNTYKYRINPSILVLDEPTVGIDAKHVKEFYDVLFRLKEQSVTILLVTHDIGVVVDHADEVACLNEHLHFHHDHERACCE